MANNYDKILELANANNMGLSNTIKRDFGIPLDYTSVQASYEAALTYAATNTLAYVGQPISVGDKLYIVTAESQGKYPAEVEEGGSQIDVFLAEVGSATEGDGNTIDLKDGVLSLHGIDGKTSGTYVPTLVDGVLTWNAPDNTTVDGLTASVDALNLKVFGKPADEEAGTEKVDGLVDAVAANIEAIAANTESIQGLSEEFSLLGDMAYESSSDYVSRADFPGCISGIRFATPLDTGVQLESRFFDGANEGEYTSIGRFEGANGIEVYREDNGPIYVDGTALSNRIKAIEDKDFGKQISDIDSAKADKATTLAGYNIGDAYTKEEVNSLVSSMTHMSTKIVEAVPTVETAELGVIYLVQDENADAGTYIEYILVEDGDIKSVEKIGSTVTDLSDYITTGALATTLAPYAKTNDVVTNDEFTQFEQANSQAISDARTGAVSDVAAVGYALERSVADRLAGKVDTNTLNSYYTKEEADDLLDTKAGAEATTQALATKIESAQIRHTSEGVGEGVEKSGTALTITVDAYTKAEVYTRSETDAAITAKINSVTGGESAADVKLALEDYRDALNTEVWGESAKSWTTRTTGEDGKVTVIYTPQYGTTSRVDALESNVATLTTNLEKAQTDATNAGTAVETLKTTTVADNTRRIGVIEGQITGDDGLSARIGALETKESTHATEYANLKAKVDTAVDTSIPAILVRVGNNESAITTINNTLNGVDGGEGLVATVAKKANAADVYTKNEVEAKVITSGEVVRGTTDSVAIADNKITVTLNSYTRGEVDDLLANLDQTELEQGIANNAADIAVLIGDDKDENGRANKSIRTIAAEEINTLIKAADPEDGKTIENITNLVKYVDENAGEIAELVTATQTNTDKLAGIDGTVKNYVDTAIDAIPEYVLPTATSEVLGGVKSATGDNKVTVAEDGVMSVATVNVNTLTQTAGDILILNGGSATAFA